MRPEPFAEIVAGLSGSMAAVVIVGLGGAGKTTMAREIAQGCIDGRSGLPKFEAVVWIDVSKLAGTPTLRSILNAISYAFESPGFAQLAEDEQRRKIEELFGLHKVLLIIDNFETISDRALLEWLLCLSEPSKALITAREDRRDFRRALTIELGGLSQEESFAFMRQQLQAPKIRVQARDLDQFQPLIDITDGNPKALDVCLSMILYAHRSIEQVMGDLRSGRVGELDGILGRAWLLLNEMEQKILFEAALFPTGASEEALGETAKVKGEGLVAALERLANLKLLDVQQSNFVQRPRYSVHSLVKAFVQSKLLSQPQVERACRVSWVEWAKRMAITAGGWAWENPKRLQVLKPEEENLYAAISWAAGQPSDDEFMANAVLTIAQGIDHYYYIRGLWDRKEHVDRMRIDAAHALGDLQEEARGLAQHIQLLCRKGDVGQAGDLLSQLREVERKAGSLGPDVHTQVQHTYAFHLMAQQEYDRAHEILEQCRHSDLRPSDNLDVATLHWIATCLYKLQRYAEAKAGFEEALSQAQKIGYQRSVIYCRLHLAKIALDEEELADASGRLAVCLEEASSLGDLRYIAQIQVTYAAPVRAMEQLPIRSVCPRRSRAVLRTTRVA